ncbi:MAG: NAD(P)-dependent oxidoreductase [Bacteroidia bacterium]
MPTIGWIGLGNMGIPMSKRLIQEGLQVTVYNRDITKTTELVSLGAAQEKSIAKLVDAVDVVVVMVSDDQAITEIFQGNDGILSSSGGGKVIINMSTVSPGISKEMAIFCRERGNVYLDAPVSGSVRQAEDGQLVIMVGGDKATFERVEPLLAILGKLSLLVGDTGAGNIAKLAINNLLAIHAQGLAETMIFAEKCGILNADLTTLIANSAIGNVFMKIKGEAIMQHNYKAVFAVKHIAKDLRLAKAEGLASPLADTVYQSFQAAEETIGNEDIIAIVKQLQLNY